MGLVFTFLLAIGAGSSHAGPPCASTVHGDLEVLGFESQVFPGPRKLRILLPPGYRAPANQHSYYPVVYFNDGQNVFDICTSLYNPEEWRADEISAELVAKGDIPPLVIVGIDNGGHRLRPHEYLPYPDDTLSPPDPAPAGKLYPRFLLDEVVPFVESRFRVARGPQHRLLAGSSYGAGAALYALVARPGSFAGLLLESPSVYASNYQLLKDAAHVRQWPARVFLGTGTVQEPIDDVRRLEKLFRRAGLDDRRLKVVVTVGGGHSERWWSQRLPAALIFLLGDFAQA